MAVSGGASQIFVNGRSMFFPERQNATGSPDSFVTHFGYATKEKPYPAFPVTPFAYGLQVAIVGFPVPFEIVRQV